MVGPGAPLSGVETKDIEEVVGGEPAFDAAMIAFGRWTADYADASTFFGPLLDGTRLTDTGNNNIAYFDRPKYNRAIERIDRMAGDARRKAWAALDVGMTRNDPPWAPFLNGARADFVSTSFG